MPQPITVTFLLPLPMPIGASLLGGSVAGSVTDWTFSGTGGVGGVLGVRWAKAGHGVTFGSRDPASPKVRQLLERCGPSAFAFAGQTRNVPAASFGLPGRLSPGQPPTLRSASS